MATFTAYKAFDISNIQEIDINSHSGSTTQHTYTATNGDFFTYTGTGLGYDSVAHDPTSTTVTSITFNMDGGNLWKIATASALDMDSSVYDDGYFYNNTIGTLFGLTAEVAWWLKGDDTVNGSSQNDVLRGYDGNDTVNGNVGNDVVTGNRGNDTVNGGDGNDTVSGGSGVNIVNGGNGTDTTKYDWAEFGVKVNLSLTTAQVLNATSVVATDTLTNVENLVGSAFIDTLTGSILANTISGGGGSDTISSSAGNDVIIGQGGNDALTGGTGLDSFVFNSTLSAVSNIDTIKDFVVADDTIKLENSIFKKLIAVGTLSSANFKASTTGNAADSTDYITYETDTGKLFYDADGSGAGAKVQIALIGTSTHAVLTPADFVVI